MADCQKGSAGSTRVHRVTVMAAEAEDLPICWICLDGPSIDRPLMHPCRCPSFVHATCIARWQLQSAGTRREKFCDFCTSELPDWKSVLTPSPRVTAPAVMNVNFDNKTYSFHVAPGVDGYRQFTEAIRRAFHLPDDSELNITFTCDEPSTGSLLTLSGPGAYDAAVHCASVSAARRGSSTTGSSSSSSSEGTLHPLLPALQQQDVRQQQHPDESSDVSSDDSHPPPGTPRQSSDRQLPHQPLPLPSRPSTAGSASSSSRSGGGGDSASAWSAAVASDAEEDHASEQLQSPSSHSGLMPSPSLLHARDSSSGNRLRRSFSRGRSLISSSLEASTSSPSMGRSHSAGSSIGRGRAVAAAAGTGRTAVRSPSLPESPAAASEPRGCVSRGVPASSNLVAEVEQGSGLDSSVGSSSSSNGGSSSSSTAVRRGAGLGKKLRSVLAELLISK